MENFTLGSSVVDALRDIWPVFRVKSNVEALEKAIALAAVASRYIDDNGDLRIIDSSGKHIIVNVREPEC